MGKERKRGIEAVIKVGGSLAEGDGLEALCRKIAALGERHHLLLVPGGGPFADLVRTHYRRYQLSETAAHKMAILAMDQYGYLLGDLVPGSVPVFNPRVARAVSEARLVPIFIPSGLLLRTDPFPHSWAVTSDSIAAWVASQVNPAQLILLKNVEGLYTVDPREEKDAKLLTEVSIDQLAHYKGVDKYFALAQAATKAEIWIISGEHPERLEELIEEGSTRGTCLRRE